MDDELFDEAATRRVAHRALVSAGLALAGATAAGIVPLHSAVTIPFLVIAIAVAVSAIRTLNHPEASVIGGVRHLGIVLAALGIVAGLIGLVLRVLLLLRT
jgi:hypothetical protein